MIAEISPAQKPYRERLMKAFWHTHTEVSVFSAEEFPPELLEIFVSLVEEGRPLAEMESDYFEISGHDPLSFMGMANQLSRPHLKSFVLGIKALLAHKQHCCKAIDYVMANIKLYAEVSKGVFDEPNRKLKRMPLVSSFPDLPNFCRQADGSLRSQEAISELTRFSLADPDVLILSAIVNLDSDAVTLLTKCLESEKVYGILKGQIQKCPDFGLDEALGHFLAKRTHVIYGAEMKQLMTSDHSTYEDYEKTFWPEASPFAIDTLVSNGFAVCFEREPSRERMLQLFKDKGVDLYPGMILASKGQPAYFDVLTDPPELSDKQQVIMDFVMSRAAMESEQDLSIMLKDIALEVIRDHKRGQDLLKHLYKGTRHKDVLKMIEDKQFRGQMLDDELGL
jgi:hypothetical protein